jgi:signal transduction histidine kinase
MKVGDVFGGDRVELRDESIGEAPEGPPKRPRPRAPTGRARSHAARRAEHERRLRNVIRVLEHEMRTPLATSLLHLSAAEAAMADAGAHESAKAALAGAARQIRTLSLIVRRAVQIESAEPIDLHPQRVDLAELVTEFMARLRATGAALWNRIEVKVAKALVGHFDPAIVEQILENLLSNALKFGEGRPIVVTVAPERGGARLSVRDAGAGIEAKDRERIFARFGRSSSARGIAGLGIGLWVVRHLIRAHGGRVGVRSRAGKGTVFDVWLPQLSLYPASTSLSRSAWATTPLGRRGSKGPMRSRPFSAAKRTRSPTL